MLKEARKERIINIISKKKSISVRALAKELYVSEATVRRDLSELEKSGVLSRSHGGAVLQESIGSDNPSLVREKQHVHEKRKIAELAHDFLGHDSTIFIDSSSSAGAVIPHICSAGGISVITNGIRNCIALMERGNAKVYLCGGLVSTYSDAVLGVTANRYVSQFNADLCIISCGGINVNGVTEASPDQAEIKRLMLKNSKVKILLCDGSKFGKTYMSMLCGFEDIDYILTDTRPDSDIENAVRKSGCEIIIGE